MTLRAVHGNRGEALLAALVEALPPLDPFAPQTIVIGSHLVGRWVMRELAFARGIATGVELLTFDRFVERTWGTVERAPGAAAGADLVALDRRQLAAAIASVLADAEAVRRLPAVAAYLAAAPDAGDRAGPRRVQLADHLAYLYWSYAMTRPDWMPALSTGVVPGELREGAEARTAEWQARLLGEALGRLGVVERPVVPTPMLPWARRRAGLPPPRAPGPISVIGMSFLARAQLEALSDLGETTDVTLYFLDPCRELWDDVASRATASASVAAEIDPLPLVLWGRPVRDTLAALVERTAGDLEPRFDDDDDDGDGGDGEDVRPARARLLADVAARTPPPAPGDAARAATAAGVVVHACPNVRRELAIVADLARTALADDATLRAHEIAVWIAGDADRYLAQTPAAFEAVGLPCHLVDAPIDDRGRIAEAVLALLELPTSTMARRDLLRVMTHPAVLQRFPHVDAADWIRWTERLGIAHGADGRAFEGTYLEEHRGNFHWDQGVRRLALGAFMVGDRAARGPVKIADLVVAPEEVKPDLQASAASYALLVRSLCADAAWLADREATLREWADLFVGLVDAYLALPNRERAEVDASRDIERVRGMLAGLAHLDRDDRRMGFREARAHAIQRLSTARTNRGEPLASGVMVAPLQAMHAIPARVTFVVGLDAGAFPAGETASPLDLRREPRRGDVSARDRDRAAFLEVLLDTRDALHLSYVALEPKSGQPLGPSSIVLELADALAPYLGAPSSAEALARLTVAHPLHRFSRAAAETAGTIARERWAAETRDAIRAHLRNRGHAVPDEEGMQALVDHGPLHAALGLADIPTSGAGARRDSISIAKLRGFLEYPVQAWAATALGLDELPDDAAVEQSDEPFQLDRMHRAVLLREVFAENLRDPGADLAARYDHAVHERTLRGQFPVGVFAEAARVVDLRVLETWRQKLGAVVVGAATRFGFGRASSPGAQLHPAIELVLPGDRRVRLTGQTELLLANARGFTSIVTMIRGLKKKSPYHLRGAFDHLLLAAAGLALDGHTHQLVDPDGNSVIVHHAPWSIGDARTYLAELVTELLDHPHGYLLPFDNLVRALANHKALPARVAIHTGDPTAGLGYGPVQRRDGLHPPAPHVAHALAHRRLGPLVQRMSGDHGFEVAS